MKFLVDETPIYKFDCPFCIEYCGKSGYFCEFDEGECDLNDDLCECRWLKETKVEDKKPTIDPAILNILNHPHEIKPYKSPTGETMQIVRLMAEPPKVVVPTMPIKLDDTPAECNKLCKRSQRVCDYCKEHFIMSDVFYRAKRVTNSEYVTGYLVRSKKDGKVEGILTDASNFNELAFIDESTLEEEKE